MTREVLKHYLKSAFQGRLNKTADQVLGRVENLVSQMQSGHLRRLGHRGLENEVAAMPEMWATGDWASVTPKLPSREQDWNATLEPAEAASFDGSCRGFVRDPLLRTPK